MRDGEPTCDCPVDNGVIRHQRATCTDGIVAWFGWYADAEPESPGTIEDIVAESIEHQSNYRNELRHLPPLEHGFNCFCGDRVTECREVASGCPCARLMG